MMFVYLNRKLIEAKKARISVFDHGYLYGDGVFETMPAYGGKALFEKEHLARMKKTAAAIRIKLNTKEVSIAIRKTLLTNKLKDAYIRASLSRGEGETGLTSKCRTPTLLIIAKPLPARPQKLSCSTYVQDYANPLNAKTLSFLNYVIARKSSKSNEVIIVSKSGDVKEGSTSNVFIVKDGKVLTPPAEGIVDGITRKAVLNLCKKKGIACQERTIRKEELFSADECFATSSIRGIAPIASIDGRKKATGPTTRRLMEAYERLMRSRTLSGAF